MRRPPPRTLPRCTTDDRPATPVVAPWLLASLLALVAALGGCREREVIFEPLWQGDVVEPRFGGSLGDGSGAPIADAAGAIGDAGAGPSDANAAADADLPDGGALDANPSDAGSPDAGSVDASPPDGGPPDGVVPDAGVPDAGVPDAGPPDADATLVDTGADVAPPTPSFPVLWSNVFQLYGCASPACHGASTAWPIFVDMQSSYASLLSNPATGPCKPSKYVVKGLPDASLLLQKIDAKLATCGEKMPNAAGVAPEDAQAVRDWIAAGAPF